MDIIEIMKARHSVRQYKNQPIEKEKRERLNECIRECNKEGNLNIQIMYEEPKCFDSMMAHYGKFSGVNNYIVLVGQKNALLEETTGYYGEKIVLLAQKLGLNTCWVAMTHGKTTAQVKKNEKITCVIALGYGSTQGNQHNNKALEEVSNGGANEPEWFQTGMEAVMLAPTAVNQQKFVFEYQDNVVTARTKKGPCTKIDLGIVKYHFEAATGVKVQ